jgi:LysR family transcriptional regulator, hca operon transcriptional activator
MPDRYGKLELRRLQYFVAVAKEGSVSEAARVRLHTAQPSLSRQLRELKNELGVQLFERRPRGIVLTRLAGVSLSMLATSCLLSTRR